MNAERLQALEHVVGVPVTDALDELAPGEYTVLVMRWGLDTGHPRTLEDVASQLGLSLRAVRTLEVRALRRLQAGDVVP